MKNIVDCAEGTSSSRALARSLVVVQDTQRNTNPSTHQKHTHTTTMSDNKTEKRAGTYSLGVARSCRPRSRSESFRMDSFGPAVLDSQRFFFSFSFLISFRLGF